MFSSDIRFGKHLAKHKMPVAKVMSATARYQNLVVSYLKYYRNPEALTLPVKLIKSFELCS